MAVDLIYRRAIYIYRGCRKGFIFEEVNEHVLAPFSRIPCCDANVLIELAITGSMLFEVLGIT